MSGDDPPSPYSLAELFCKAILLRRKLPHADKSPELAEALLAYDPRTCQGLKSKTRRYRSLMLEAISRCRLNATKELHRLCPRLLSSIPLFDDAPTLSSPPTSSQISDASSSHTNLPGANSAPGKRNFHSCSHKRNSTLLEMAYRSQKNALLVFILENHPDVCKKVNDLSAVEKPSPQRGKKQKERKSTLTRNSEERGHRSIFLCAVLHLEGTNAKAKWPDSNIVNIINICIKNNNPEVLQYLLYKSIWKFFLPFDKSQGTHSLDSECTCSWFLHCAAITRSSRLLHSILSGQFNHQYTKMSPSSSKNILLADSQQHVGNETQTGFQSKSKSLTDSRKDVVRGSPQQDPNTASSSSTPFSRTLSLERGNSDTASNFQKPGLSEGYEVCSWSDPNRLWPISFPTNPGLSFLDPTFGMCVKVAPLHLASWCCDPTSMQELVDHGAAVNQLTQQVDSLDAVVFFKQFNVSSLFMLAMGIRYPKGFPFIVARQLGLVSYPAWDTLRSGAEAKQNALEAVRVLSDAGCDLNATCIVNGVPVRTLEFLLKPTLFLFENALFELDRMKKDDMAKTTLSVSWELLTRGASLSSVWSSRMEWNLSHMDLMHVPKEPIQKQVLHLAAFLGLFQPLTHAWVLEGNLDQGSHDQPISFLSYVTDSGVVRESPQDRQKRCLQMCVYGAIKLSLSTSCLMQMFYFLPLADLHLLARFTQAKLMSSPLQEEERNLLQNFSDAVDQAQLRTLQHSCKLIVLRITRWRPSSVHRLTVPDLIKEYLLSPD